MVQADQVHEEEWKGWEDRLRERDALEICAVLPGVGRGRAGSWNGEGMCLGKKDLPKVGCRL